MALPISQLKATLLAAQLQQQAALQQAAMQQQQAAQQSVMQGGQYLDRGQAAMGRGVERVQGYQQHLDTEAANEALKQQQISQAREKEYIAAMLARAQMQQKDVHHGDTMGHRYAELASRDDLGRSGLGIKERGLNLQHGVEESPVTGKKMALQDAQIGYLNRDISRARIAATGRDANTQIRAGQFGLQSLTAVLGPQIKALEQQYQVAKFNPAEQERIREQLATLYGLLARGASESYGTVQHPGMSGELPNILENAGPKDPLIGIMDDGTVLGPGGTEVPPEAEQQGIRDMLFRSK